ncbi:MULTISPECIES: hypothetical protein [Kitasatospora]|uniref:Uncharacterized protein n=1 Tax=Kitasatospora setae (strain ATCC 33774 / DSM 43861 / JCM 3304 / KCC A-0304 / NBRC 14216 / KM-6054) TaxID=452652 RepID=E4NBN3_KITSK|nr:MULTISPECIES: hypothetical protein [Kitasatospora]BAJ28614.1 hypothetical protein KSE_28030 [Kitasatospora setae KM-6054]
MAVRARNIGLRVAALGAAALVLTACNDDETTDAGAATSSHPAASAPASAGASPTGKAKSKPKESPKPSTHASTSAAGANAAAQAKVNKLVLSAADWGKGFEADGEDSTDISHWAMNASCVNVTNGDDPDQVAADNRFVIANHSNGDATLANTWVVQFTTKDAAHKYLTNIAADAKRCEKSTTADGETKYNTSHEVVAPQVAGADEVYAEEGFGDYATTDGGRTGDRPYGVIYARKGSIVVMANVDSDPSTDDFEFRRLAQQAIKQIAAKW